jgi:hypothetical protein
MQPLGRLEASRRRPAPLALRRSFAPSLLPFHAPGTWEVLRPPRPDALEIVMEALATRPLPPQPARRTRRTGPHHARRRRPRPAATHPHRRPPRRTLDRRPSAQRLTRQGHARVASLARRAPRLTARLANPGHSRGERSTAESEAVSTRDAQPQAPPNPAALIASRSTDRSAPFGRSVVHHPTSSNPVTPPRSSITTPDTSETTDRSLPALLPELHGTRPQRLRLIGLLAGDELGMRHLVTRSEPPSR